MDTRRLCIVVFLVLVSCTPLVPMPDNDLYSSSQSSRATAQALLDRAQMQERALTATSQAPIIRITETAAAISVQSTQAEGTNVASIQTQGASWTQTAQWWTPTPNATSTAVFALLNAQGTQMANTLERDRLALERDQMMNDFNAKVVAYSWVIVVLVAAWLIMMITRRWRYQTVKVDARGNVLPILDIVDGVVTDSDRNPNYKGSVSKDILVRFLELMLEKKYGLKPALPLITAARQDATTERDQMIDLASRGLPGTVGSENKEQKKLAGQQMMKQLTDSNLQSRFKVLDGSTSDLAVIDGVVIDELDNAWKDADKK